MKRTGKCPKCGSSHIQVFSIQGPGAFVSFGGRVPQQGGLRVERYACGGCGFIEEWLAGDGAERVRESMRLRGQE